jgi:RNA polymerase-interacting CarD/CdnL/TRCF family regulator
MEKVELKLNKGDLIVHSLHGIGTVKGIISRELQGKKHAFYRVKTNRLTY